MYSLKPQRKPGLERKCRLSQQYRIDGWCWALFLLNSISVISERKKGEYVTKALCKDTPFYSTVITKCKIILHPWTYSYDISEHSNAQFDFTITSMDILVRYIRTLQRSIRTSLQSLHASAISSRDRTVFFFNVTSIRPRTFITVHLYSYTALGFS